MRNQQADSQVFAKNKNVEAGISLRSDGGVSGIEPSIVSHMVVVHADHAPMKGVDTPGPHQIYRNSRVSVQQRVLGDLHPDNIRVEMLCAGICGTDLHLLTNHPATGYICCSAPSEIPATGRVLGHEGVGRILAIGDNVQHVKPGNYITMESILVCHCCIPCKSGKFNQCCNAKLLGMEKDGVFGSVVDIPAMIAHDITALVRSEQDIYALACVEPSAVAYVACENAKITPGDVVLVFGAGPIGLLTAMMSKEVFGASEVHVIEPIPFRRTFAKKWADYVYDVEEFFTQSSQKVDIVFEASGYLENVTRVFRRINPNGSVVLLARRGEKFVLEHVDHMITNEISIVGSRGHLGRAFSKIFNLYNRGRISPGDIITKVLDSQEELCAFLNEKEQTINKNCKVLLKFRD